MLYEYAVDPAALGSSWARCRYILDQAGWDVGRLIARYPRKTWKAAALEAAKDIEGDIERARVREAIELATRYKCIKLGREVQDAAADWIDDAKLQQRVVPFQAIVADTPNDGAYSVLNIDAVSVADPLWQCPANWQVPKTGAAIASALEPLVRHSRDFKLIDPYFDVTGPRYLPTLVPLMTMAAAHGLEAVEVHCEERDQVLDIGALTRQAPHGLQAQIPNGLSLRIYWWKAHPGGRRLHARYSVSEKGGVRIDHGFSEQPGALEDLSLMSEDVRADVFDAFSSGSTIFNQIGDGLEITNGSIARIAP